MTFISTVPQSKLVQSLLGLAFFVQLAIFVHDYFTVRVVELGRAYCSFQDAPISYFYSAEHLLDSVHD